MNTLQIILAILTSFVFGVLFGVVTAIAVFRGTLMVLASQVATIRGDVTAVKNQVADLMRVGGFRRRSDPNITADVEAVHG
jgi:hypothetical protein